MSSDENETEFVLFKDRPEWKDVTPIKQDDGEDSIVSIDYSSDFTDAFDYFRAVVKSGEKSERALELTEVAASINPANYTVWQYRREILKALGSDLGKEMKYSYKVILNNMKNYQVWHHRKILVEWTKDPSNEKHLTEVALAKDAKNYHVWQHRQWVIRTFDLFDGELDYVDTLLDDDIRNNSAWNQRYFVINNTTGFTEEVLNREIDYTIAKIQILLDNESAWNYLRGLILHDKEGLSKNVKVTQFCEQLYAEGKRSPFLLAVLVDMCYEQVGEGGGGDSTYTLERAKQLCEELATKYDTIRAKYWEHMAETIGKKSSGQMENEDALK